MFFSFTQSANSEKLLLLFLCEAAAQVFPSNVGQQRVKISESFRGRGKLCAASNPTEKTGPSESLSRDEKKATVRVERTLRVAAVCVFFALSISFTLFKMMWRNAKKRQRERRRTAEQRENIKNTFRAARLRRPTIFHSPFAGLNK